MRGGMVAHGALAHASIHDRVNLLADVNSFSRFYSMRAHALHRHHAADHIGDDGIVLVVVEPSDIADLSARLGVKRCVIENDFAFFASAQLFYALAIVNNGE